MFCNTAVFGFLINLLLLFSRRVRGDAFQDVNDTRDKQGMKKLDFVVASEQSPVGQLAGLFSGIYHNKISTVKAEIAKAKPGISEADKTTAAKVQVPSTFSALVRQLNKSGTVTTTFICTVMHEELDKKKFPNQKGSVVRAQVLNNLVTSIKETKTTSNDSFFLSVTTANLREPIKLTSDDLKTYFEVLLLPENSAKKNSAAEYSELYHPSTVRVESRAKVTGRNACIVVAYMHDLNTENETTEIKKAIENFQQLWHNKNFPNGATSAPMATECGLLKTVANDYASRLLQEETNRVRSSLEGLEEKEIIAKSIRGIDFTCTFFLVQKDNSKVLEKVMNEIGKWFDPEFRKAQQEQIEQSTNSGGSLLPLDPYQLLFGKKNIIVEASNKKLSVVTIIHDSSGVHEAENMLKQSLDVINKNWKLSPLKLDLTPKASEVAQKVIESELNSHGPGLSSSIFKDGTCGVFSEENKLENVTYVHYTRNTEPHNTEGNGEFILKLLNHISAFQKQSVVMDQNTAPEYSYFNSITINFARETIPEDILYALVQLRIIDIGFGFYKKTIPSGHNLELGILRIKTKSPLLLYYGTKFSTSILNSWRNMFGEGLSQFPLIVDAQFIDEKLCQIASELGNKIIGKELGIRCGVVYEHYFAVTWSSNSSEISGAYMNESRLKWFTQKIRALLDRQMVANDFNKVKLVEYANFSEFSTGELAKEEQLLQLITELVQPTVNKVSFAYEDKDNSVVITLIWRRNTKTLTTHPSEVQRPKNIESPITFTSSPAQEQGTGGSRSLNSLSNTHQERRKTVSLDDLLWMDQQLLPRSKEKTDSPEKKTEFCLTTFIDQDARLKKIRTNFCGGNDCNSEDFEELQISGDTKNELKLFFLDLLSERNSEMPEQPRTGLALAFDTFAVTFGLYNKSHLLQENPTMGGEFEPTDQAIDMLLKLVENCQHPQNGNRAKIVLSKKSLENQQPKKFVHVLEGISPANLCHFVSTKKLNVGTLVYEYDNVFLAAIISSEGDMRALAVDVMNSLRENPNVTPRVNVNYIDNQDPNEIFAIPEFRDVFESPLSNAEINILMPFIRIGLAFMLVNQIAGQIPSGVQSVDFTYKKTWNSKDNRNIDVDGFLHYRYTDMTTIPSKVWFELLKQKAIEKYQLSINLKQSQNPLIKNTEVDFTNKNGFWISETFAITIHTTPRLESLLLTPNNFIENFLEACKNTQPGLGDLKGDTNFICVKTQVSTLDMFQLSLLEDGEIDVGVVVIDDYIKLVIVFTNWSVEQAVFCYIRQYRPNERSANVVPFRNDEGLAEELAALIGYELQNVDDDENTLYPLGQLTNDNSIVTFMRSPGLADRSEKIFTLRSFIDMIRAVINGSNGVPDSEITLPWITDHTDLHTIRPAASSQSHKELMNYGGKIRAIARKWKHKQMIFLVAYSSAKPPQFPVKFGEKTLTSHPVMRGKATQVAKHVQANYSDQKAGCIVMNNCVALFAHYSNAKDIPEDGDITKITGFVTRKIERETKAGLAKRLGGALGVVDNTASKMLHGIPTFIEENSKTTLQNFLTTGNTIQRVFAASDSEFGAIFMETGKKKGIVVLVLRRNTYPSTGAPTFWHPSVMYSTPVEFICNEIWSILSAENKPDRYGIGELNDAEKRIRFIFCKQTQLTNPKDNKGHTIRNDLLGIIKVNEEGSNSSNSVGTTKQKGRKRKMAVAVVKAIWNNTISSDKYYKIIQENTKDQFKITKDQLNEIQNATIVGIHQEAVILSNKGKSETWAEIAVIAYDVTPSASSK